MSKFSRFLKENKAVRENVKYVPTKSFTDENGNPIEWTIKPLTTKEAEAMRDKYTKDVPILGKPNQFKQQLDVAKYNASLIAKSVVEPNLNDAELRDSYGVKTPEALIVEMIDNPGEYSQFLVFVTELNGFTDINDDVEKAKN